MKSLPVGTKLKRSYDEAIYEKMKASNDPKQVCEWRSPRGSIYISDVSAQTNTKQFELLD